MSEEVILINSSDEVVGTCEKLEAHEKGHLHRAFSVLIFNSNGEILIQKRADGKYHSASLWSNACCSHPRPNEDMSDAVKRRLIEEIGIECNVEFLFKFIYKVDFENGLIEHELDYVFKGTTDQTPELNPDEVSEFRYLDPVDLKKEMEVCPQDFTFWFHLIMEKFK